MNPQPDRPRQWTSMRLWAAAYERGGVAFVRGGLLALQALGFVVAVGSCALIRLYAPITLGGQTFVAMLAFFIYATEAVLAIRSMRPALRALDSWGHTHDNANAEIAWPAVADLPFAPLRSRTTHVLVAALIVAWDVVAVWRLGLSSASVPVLFVGSLLVWLYWLALRFFASERLVRPALADISTNLPHGVDPSPVRITLIRRLLVAVPAITVIAGTAVAGIVGTHEPQTIAVGAGASILVAVGIASWLMVLLAQSVTEPIIQLQTAADRVGHGDLQVQVPIVSVDEIGSLAHSFNAMVAGLRDRDYIRDTFGTYVDPAVAEHILARGAGLTEGEEVEITALFLDVRGFTGYAERHTAAEVVAMLNRLFELVVPIIARHGGHVDKFIGDGLLAVFGAPQPLPDHPEQALAAAVEIATTITARPGDEPRIGIGLNSGPVVAGNIGGSGRYDFSVIGDVVNVAARVESATRYTGDTILVSEHTRLLLPPDSAAALIARPAVPMKGKTQTVDLYAP